MPHWMAIPAAGKISSSRAIATLNAASERGFWQLWNEAHHVADAVVVGAGVGGLATAIALGARGLRVELLDAADKVGGKLATEEIDGVDFDTGPSVLTLPDTLDAVLRLAGTRLEDELTLREPDPSFRYLFPDGTRLDVFPELERTLASVRGALGGAAERELEAFLDYARRIWDASAPHFVYGPAPGPGTLLRAGVNGLGALTRIDALRTMRAAIHARVKSGPLRMLLMRYATYNGSDVRRAPATLNCISHVELGMGGWGVEGGMYQVARALERAAGRVGVRIHPGMRVERILTDGERARGVATADGKEWPADAVVANADAAHVFATLLPGVLSPRRIPRTEASMSAWTGVLRARRRTASAARVAHTVLFPAEYDEEFSDIFDQDRPPAEPTVYLCAQEACHGRRGWMEEEPVFVMANAPAEPNDRSRPAVVYEQFRERVLRRIDEAGLRDAGDSLVWERTPADLATAFPGSRGSIYGAASNGPWSAFRRPGNRVRSAPGVYLASGSAHPGGGVPLCLLSGQAAAAAVLRDRHPQRK